MKKATIAVAAVAAMMVSLTPMLFTEPWWKDKPEIPHIEPVKIQGEVMAKLPESLNTNSCWQLGLRTLQDREIKWICVTEEEWNKSLLQSTYSR